MPKVQRKYDFSGETKEFSGHTLHRIRAVRDFDTEFCHVKAGDLGGGIESEKNLDQNYTAWVADEAMVFEKACVSEEACVSGHAQVFGEAIVTGGAEVTDNARIFGDAFILDFVKIYGDTKFFGDAMVSDAVYDHGVVMHTLERDVKSYFTREPGDVWGDECSRNAITDDGRYMEITCKAPDLKQDPGESEDEYEARLLAATEWGNPIRVTDIRKDGKQTVVAENGNATFSLLRSGIIVYTPDDD